MSAVPDSQIKLQATHPLGLSPVQFAALSAVLAVLGLSTIWSTVLSFWVLWTTDALKSIGMVIPLVSLVLILRAWRGLGWKAEGNWWGLVLILIAFAVARVREQSLLILVLSPRWSTLFPPPSLVLLAYASGTVLLLGGPRLFRAALFPILLLWCANPIPSRLDLFLDVPLQHAAAHVARAFAMRLGHALTPDQLRLMFTPDFGMFIAPGCDGIRGATTMAFIALIAGYVYRFRWYATGLVVGAAILLGYVFNLARLCLLVLYYALALHFTWLQDKAENADYLIGGMLFLLASLLLFAVIGRLRGVAREATPKPAGGLQGAVMQGQIPGVQYARLAAMALTVLFAWVGLARVLATAHSPVVLADTVAPFPPLLGSYALARSWNETLPNGSVVYFWGEYASADGMAPIAIGVSPLPDWHDPALCHFVRGDDPIWQGQITAKTASADPVALSAALYSNGAMRYLEASTECSRGACNEFATGRAHFGFVYSRPDPASVLNEEPRKPIRILLHAETTDMALPANVARQQLTASLLAFLASVKLEDLAQPYSR
jgi:exosortase J